MSSSELSRRRLKVQVSHPEVSEIPNGSTQEPVQETEKTGEESPEPSPEQESDHSPAESED